MAHWKNIQLTNNISRRYNREVLNFFKRFYKLDPFGCALGGDEAVYLDSIGQQWLVLGGTESSEAVIDVIGSVEGIDA